MTNPFNVKKPASVTDIKEHAADASDNFAAERQVGMTFNMPRSWHTEFKMRATQEGMSMRDLLFASFDAFKKQNR